MSTVKIKKPDLRDGVLYTRNLILRSMCAIYLIAFVTFYHQSSGLFGDNGVLPARLQIDNISTAKVSAMHKRPTLLHLSSFLGLNTSYMVDVLALLGALISFTGFISQKFCLLTTFASLWSLYYSLVQIGQVFVNQSDNLLLEAGILCIILAPLNSHKKRSPVDGIAMDMLRWLLFRYLFASGSVKLTSGCSYWWNLTAFSHHFETLPLPTPLSWYVHHLPAEFLRLNVVFANLTELICPWLFFVTNRGVRQLAFHWQLFLHFHIILSGNYGLLNFLIITISFSLLDDTYFYGIRSKTKARQILNGIATALAIIGVLAIAFIHFGLRYKYGEILTKITFTKQQYLDILKTMIKVAPLCAVITLGTTFLNTIISHPSIKSPTTVVKKMFPILTTLVFTLICFCLIGVSTVPQGNLHPGTNITNTQMGKFYSQAKKLNIVNEYGKHLRTMRPERLELILEHSQHVEGPWVEYSFLYKPWNVNHSLPFSGPYLPRLDMKFYEAAISNYNDQLWVSSLAFRLLQNEESVLKLLGIQSKISPTPKFIKASTYKFKYTSWSEKSGIAYWTRRKVGEFLPVYSLEDTTLQAYLKTMKISTNYRAPPVKNSVFQTVLNFIRNQTSYIEGSFLIFCVLSAGFAIIASQKRDTSKVRRE